MKIKGGFSLIEIVIFCFIAITIITLFVGLALNSREFSQTMGCINNMKMIAQAIENFQADNKESPRNLANLYPLYIKNEKIFKCPADRSSASNSYDKFYIGRFFAEEDAQKVFLVCPRHNRGNKTVCAYLSYAVAIGKTCDVSWSGMPAKYGEFYSGGALQFVDGTIVDINSGKIGLLASFLDNEDKLYHIIYTPEGEEGSYTVNHQGNSRFEVITPAVIAGVEGTKFNVSNIISSNTFKSRIRVTEGVVIAQDRSQESTGQKISAGEEFESSTLKIVNTLEETPSSTSPASEEVVEVEKDKRKVPRKPTKGKKIFWFWWK
ncbi:MAG: FecR domain-containing protein [bacterium]|nr:FecR domain-containing protein [bacterium]